MIKGVNKKIIEINNPQSIYFEKAVFYLKPNVSKLPDSVANNEIERYINMLGLYENKKNSHIKRNILIAFSLAAALILLIFILIF